MNTGGLQKRPEISPPPAPLPPLPRSVTAAGALPLPDSAGLPAGAADGRPGERRHRPGRLLRGGRGGAAEWAGPGRGQTPPPHRTGRSGDNTRTLASTRSKGELQQTEFSHSHY